MLIFVQSLHKNYSLYLYFRDCGFSDWMHLRKWRTRVKWGFLNKSNLKWKGLSNIIIIIRFYSGSSLLFSIQVVSCHAFPGGRPALELTPSASPACTTLQQSHLCQTFTFHCPLLSPATNLTPGEDCSSDSLAAHSHPRNCPVLAVSPYIRESPGLCLGPSTSQSSWLFFSTFLDCLSTHHSVTVVLHPGHLSLLLYHHWPSTGTRWGQLSTQTNPGSTITMSSRRKASTPCMIRPDQTMVELDDEAEDSHDMEVHFQYACF